MPLRDSKCNKGAKPRGEGERRGEGMERTGSHMVVTLPQSNNTQKKLSHIKETYSKAQGKKKRKFGEREREMSIHGVKFPVGTG